MSKALVWLRRDLRLHDHAALHHALRSHQDVWLVFIFDTTILEPLLKKGLGFDRRVDFLWQCTHELDQNLRSQGGGLLVRHGDPKKLIPPLHGALLKNEQDVMLFERLAFMSRRQQQ